MVPVDQTKYRIYYSALFGIFGKYRTDFFIILIETYLWPTKSQSGWGHLKSGNTFGANTDDTFVIRFIASLWECGLNWIFLCTEIMCLWRVCFKLVFISHSGHSKVFPFPWAQFSWRVLFTLFVKCLVQWLQRYRSCTSLTWVWTPSIPKRERAKNIYVIYFCNKYFVKLHTRVELDPAVSPIK